MTSLWREQLSHVQQFKVKFQHSNVRQGVKTFSGRNIVTIAEPKPSLVFILISFFVVHIVNLWCSYIMQITCGMLMECSGSLQLFMLYYEACH